MALKVLKGAPRRWRGLPPTIAPSTRRPGARRPRSTPTSPSRNEGLRAAEQGIDLKTAGRADFKLDENARIGGATLARLMPMIEKLEL
jgi:hypothetical protein